MNIVPAGACFADIKDALALQTTKGGGLVMLEAGGYDFPDETLDLACYGGGLTLTGENIRATTIRSAAVGKPAILGASPTASLNTISNLGLRHSSGARPTKTSEMAYGLYSREGTGYGFNAEKLEIKFFANAAIHIEGQTGPTVIRDCSLQECFGFGLKIVRTKIAGAQNVNCYGGNIQRCLGGLYMEEAYYCGIYDVDIELQDAWDPAVLLLAGVNGCTFTNVTASIEAGEHFTAPGVVVLKDGPCGNVFTGGGVYNRTLIPNVLLQGPWTQGNKFLGGYYVGAGIPSGFAFQVEAAGRTTIMPPSLALFEAGKELLDNGLRTQVIGGWGHV